MRWNWQQANWPKFTYDKNQISEKEKRFLLKQGSSHAFLKSIGEYDFSEFVVEILSREGKESSKIEGEILDNQSLQSSIKMHFGLKRDRKHESGKESRMAKLLCDVYKTFRKPLTHKMLYSWHAELFGSNASLNDLGTYRTHLEPMQIVSRRLDSQKLFFEAPPSKKVFEEMDHFIKWFNETSDGSVLGKASIAHIYFESIHPFEDGNGRIGRLLVEKLLSQAVNKPVLIAVSKVFEKRKKAYYAALGTCNRSLKANDWVDFFSDAVLQAQEESMALLYFLIEKSKLLSQLAGQLNERQEKVLLRMFAEGTEGFKGGLSAEKYIAITKSSRATATRDLVDLVEMKALLKTGSLKHTRYWLNLTQNANCKTNDCMLRCKCPHVSEISSYLCLDFSIYLNKKRW